MPFLSYFFVLAYACCLVSYAVAHMFSQIIEDYTQLGLFPPSLLSGENMFADQYAEEELSLDASELNEDSITEDGES